MSFFPIPGRDANATFAGYIYQVNVTIARWLDLFGGDRLELEAGEDIDTVVAAAHSDSNSKKRLLEQLKQMGSNITLRTPDICVSGIAILREDIFRLNSFRTILTDSHFLVPCCVLIVVLLTVLH
jgi:hypothetical protein